MFMELLKFPFFIETCISFSLSFFFFTTCLSFFFLVFINIDIQEKLKIEQQEWEKRAKFFLQILAERKRCMQRKLATLCLSLILRVYSDFSSGSGANFENHKIAGKEH